MLFNTKKTKTTIVLLLSFSVPFFLVFSANAIDEGSWVTKAPMPSQLGGSVRAGVVNGKIYVMGNSVNFEYDPSMDVWVEKTSMPTSRDSFGLAFYQNKIYVIGGSQWTQEDGVIYFCTNEVYDPLTNTWENKEPMPTNRTGLWGSTNAVNGKIHIIVDDIHDIYTIATDSWTTGTPMPIPQASSRFSSTVFENKIYILGTDATQVYDSESETWSLGAISPIGAYQTSACATTGVMALKRIYLFGGEEILFQSTNITQVYDPINDTWTLGAPMLTARTGPDCAVVNDAIYVLGGMSGRLAYELVNEQYLPIGYIPEFPSWVTILPLLITVIVILIIYKQRLHAISSA
ncbi:MAG: hypothetical protein CW691_10540 [Candidatus Bathyarchaeum sp.]|nr:MAG: hypothetical protein CW691_10540 [Candidatus Bathyarchaeum sp.]